MQCVYPNLMIRNWSVKSDRIDIFLFFAFQLHDLGQLQFSHLNKLEMKLNTVSGVLYTQETLAIKITSFYY